MLYQIQNNYNQNSAEGGVAPAGAKVTEATIRTWLLNKFISFLTVLSWKRDKKLRQGLYEKQMHIRLWRSLKKIGIKLYEELCSRGTHCLYTEGEK